MTFGSLFAGIGGMDLGLDRAGMECRWQVEIDPFCRRVLAKHWPDVYRHDDVRTFPDGDAERYRVDLIAGGFPCQPISLAGKLLGTSDPRWLWPEFSRVVRLLRPRCVLLENSPNLLRMGIESVLGDLASLGFTAEWGCVQAHAFGAPHRRERIFLVAHAPGERGQAGGIFSGRLETCAAPEAWQSEWDGILERGNGTRLRRIPDPGVCGVAERLPRGLDRVGAIGNAVVPQVAEWIGRRIMTAADAGREGGGR